MAKMKVTAEFARKMVENSARMEQDILDAISNAVTKAAFDDEKTETIFYFNGTSWYGDADSPTPMMLRVLDQLKNAGYEARYVKVKVPQGRNPFSENDANGVREYMEPLVSTVLEIKW